MGQPPDFSGAVGGPFVVRWSAEPTTVAVEEPLTLTLRITGPGNLREMPRPALGKLDSFKPFAVEDLDDRFVDGNPPTREFRYRVRPRTADVNEIPRLKFVYFNPHVTPPSRGYQTTYADAVALAAKPRTTAKAPELPGWIIEEWQAEGDEAYYEFNPILLGRQTIGDRVRNWCAALLFQMGISQSPNWARQSPSQLWLVLVLIGPPSACLLWLVVWQRLYPGAARRAHATRSRAAVAALRRLRASPIQPGPEIGDAVRAYLQDRAGLAAAAATPGEVADGLRGASLPVERIAAVEQLLRRCDEFRFSPYPPDAMALRQDAERLILDSEAKP